MESAAPPDAPGPPRGAGVGERANAGRFAALRARLSFLSPWGPPLVQGALSKAQRRVPAVAGTLAATTALLFVLILRFEGLALFLPETAVQWVVDHIPGALEAGAVGLLGGFAKVLGVAIAIGGFLTVHALFALYYPRAEKLLAARWKLLAAFAALPAAVTLLVVLPLLGAGVAGTRLPGGAGMAAVSAVLGSCVFAGVLDLAYREFSRSNPEGIDLSRRTALQGAIIFLLAAAVGISLVGYFVTRVGRLAFASIAELQGAEVTPTDKFYVVQKNLSSPAVNPSSWSLGVDGLVDRPLTFSSNQLLSRTLTDEYFTLECVSNEVGGNLISNARWTGVPLQQLFAEAGVQAAATWVQFTCEDDYTVGVPLRRADVPGALVALHMNGERLVADHGFPARVLIPGLYGMMNAKWVKQITLVDHEVVGYWQQKGWTNDGAIRTTAIIAVAPTSAARGAPTTVGGVAFAGDRPVSRVQVSDDGGATWADAALQAPLSPYAWTLWTFAWTPAVAGRVRLEARAWEGEGAGATVQGEERDSPFPSGAAGYDAVDVTVTG